MSRSFAVAFGWLVLPAIAGQASELVLNLPGLKAQGRSLINHWDPSGSDQIAGIIQQRLQCLAVGLVALPLAVFSSTVKIGLVFIMSAYWLVSSPALHDVASSWISDERKESFERVRHAVGETVGGFVRGEIMAATAMATISYVGLTFLGVENPMVLALLAGVGELIPTLDRSLPPCQLSA